MRRSPGNAYRDLAFKDSRYSVPPPNKPTTERAFILSGGAYTRDGSFHLSWDFSDRVLPPSDVERFADLCLQELTECVRLSAAAAQG
jgi:hypothetical protein